MTSTSEYIDVTLGLADFSLPLRGEGLGGGTQSLGSIALTPLTPALPHGEEVLSGSS